MTGQNYSLWMTKTYHSYTSSIIDYDNMGGAKRQVDSSQRNADIVVLGDPCFAISVDLAILGPLLLTWLNFNPSLDKLSHPQ